MLRPQLRARSRVAVSAWEAAGWVWPGPVQGDVWARQGVCGPVEAGGADVSGTFFTVAVVVFVVKVRAFLMFPIVIGRGSGARSSIALRGGCYDWP